MESTDFGLIEQLVRKAHQAATEKPLPKSEYSDLRQAAHALPPSVQKEIEGALAWYVQTGHLDQVAGTMTARILFGSRARIRVAEEILKLREKSRAGGLQTASEELAASLRSPLLDLIKDGQSAEEVIAEGGPRGLAIAEHIESLNDQIDRAHWAYNLAWSDLAGLEGPVDTILEIRPAADHLEEVLERIDEKISGLQEQADNIAKAMKSGESTRGELKKTHRRINRLQRFRASRQEKLRAIYSQLKPLEAALDERIGTLDEIISLSQSLENLRAELECPSEEEPPACLTEGEVEAMANTALARELRADAAEMLRTAQKKRWERVAPTLKREARLLSFAADAHDDKALSALRRE